MLEKRFNFSEIEEKCLDHWSENQIFSFDNDEKKKTILYYDAATKCYW